MIDAVIRFVSALNSDDNPWQLAWGVVFGLLMGLTPTLSMHNLILLFLVCVLRVNFSFFLVFFVVFNALSIITDPYAVMLGDQLLRHTPALTDLWISLYNTDIGRLMHFHNTLTLGSLMIAVVALVPTLFIAKWLIVKYRQRLGAWFNRLHFVQVLKASKLYLLYQAIR